MESVPVNLDSRETSVINVLMDTLGNCVNVRYQFSNIFFFNHVFKKSFLDCSCSSPGSLSKECNENGNCNCKSGFKGAKCDECSNGYFGTQCQGKKFMDVRSYI